MTLFTMIRLEALAVLYQILLFIVSYFLHYRVTYYIEFLSLKLRGFCIVLLALWWAVGSIGAAVLALVIMPICKKFSSGIM